MIQDQFVWPEVYRPKTLADTILPIELKKTLQAHVDKGEMPNCTLVGGAGVGKTTAARAILDELKAQYIIIDGSTNGNIDTLRNEITLFASSVSLTGGRKYVIIDEADHLNANSTQPALRRFIEQYLPNCGFILTCNYKNRIMPELFSRCPVIEYTIPTAEKPAIAKEQYMRLTGILDKEGITYDRKVVAGLISTHFPDFRKVLNIAQFYSIGGALDETVLSAIQDTDIAELVNHMRSKNYTNVRKWVGQNSGTDDIFRKFYDKASTVFTPASIPQLVIILADYQYKAAFVADQEINLSSCLAEIMVKCDMLT
tara:strand:- start:180 stop:1118 length:939 start_codon:yes stop_codon:yes gene_type:complete